MPTSLPIRPSVFLLPFSFFLCAALGCGRTGTVTGTVTFDGRPLARGWITFYPEDKKGVARAGAVVDGVYQVEDLLPGKKKVHVTDAFEPVKVCKGGRDQVRAVPRKDALPAVLAGNDLIVEVGRGKQRLDVELKKPAR
jgi:hypothetical protein